MRLSLRFLFAASTLLALGACASSDRTSPADAPARYVICPLGGEAQSNQLESAIHDALLAHPEWLVEMSKALQQKQQAAQGAQFKLTLAANNAARYQNVADPICGNPAGDVTVVEFFDAECPFCKRLAPDLARLYGADKGIRVVFKELPILGPVSVIAAKAGLASVKQGKYEVFHNALMADATPEHQLTETRIYEIATAVHLNVAQLKQDMAAPAIDEQIAANKALAAKLGVHGTPGLIIGDTMTPGAMPYQAMVQAVAEARAGKSANGR